jgi:hypothetical protein
MTDKESKSTNPTEFCKKKTDTYQTHLSRPTKQQNFLKRKRERSDREKTYYPRNRFKENHEMLEDARSNNGTFMDFKKIHNGTRNTQNDNKSNSMSVGSNTMTDQSMRQNSKVDSSSISHSDNTTYKSNLFFTTNNVY